MRSAAPSLLLPLLLLLQLAAATSLAPDITVIASGGSPLLPCGI
eukprot:COSAG06_NODE_18134_length_902_cov_59.997003_2_plen_43_part_01